MSLAGVWVSGTCLAPSSLQAWETALGDYLLPLDRLVMHGTIVCTQNVKTTMAVKIYQVSVASDGATLIHANASWQWPTPSSKRPMFLEENSGVWV
jgi:hypothetical protein